MKVIASHNGLAGARKTYEVLAGGGSLLDALLAGIEVIEDDPNEYTVGYGGLPNEDGVVQLDAAIMHGPIHRGAGVAALENIRHPTRVARLVMEQTSRALLVGEGAKRFALANGFEEENLLTDAARKRWLHWRQSRGAQDDWLPPPEDEGGEPREKDFVRPTGTVHIAALDAHGDLACATSTSGHAFKLAGRVGDSPILGAGLYVDNRLGTCGSIGWGEANQQNLSSFAAVELLRSGHSPRDAGLEVLGRIAEHATQHQRDAEARPTFQLRLYLLSRQGEHQGVCIWGPQQIAVVDQEGARMEDCQPLYTRK